MQINGFERKQLYLWVVIFFTVMVIHLGINKAFAVEKEDEKDITDLSISKLMDIEVSTVYGASKYEQSVMEAPASVSIITAQDIKNFGYRNFAEILRSIRGLYITYDRNYHYLGIRGFASHGDYNTRFLLLIDGHRLNDSVYGMAYLGTDFILDIDLIERVEVIRGPSSSLYGTSAFLGVINVVTRKGATIGGFEVSGEIASNNTYKGRVSYGKYFDNGTEVVLSATGYDSHGKDTLYYREFDDPSTNNGIAENLDGDEFKSVFTTLSYHDFTIQGGYISREKAIPTAPWGFDFNAPGTKSIDDRAYLDMKYRHFFGDKLSILGRIYYDYYLYKGTYPIASIENKDKGEGQWWGAELQANAQLGKKHKLIAGAEYVNAFKNVQLNYDKDPYVLYLNEKQDMYNWAVYLQDEFKVLDSLTINAGIRHDHYDTFGGTTNPRFAFIYQPAKNMAFKLLYGQAFRAPVPYELYYNDGGFSQKANPNLKPETIRTYEMIFERYFTDRLRLGISLFANQYRDLITMKTDPGDGLLMFDNVDKIETKGAEIEIEKLWQNGFKAILSYAYQESKNKQTDQKLGNSPRNLVKFHLLAPIIKGKLSAGLEEQYISKRLLINGNETGGALITNLMFFSWDVLKGLEISLSAYNLFNVTYEDPGSQEHLQDMLEQDGRGLRLKVSYRF